MAPNALLAAIAVAAAPEQQAFWLATPSLITAPGSMDSIASTNAYLSGLLKEGEVRDELVVTADYQESGKGQGDHNWFSSPGKNLLMSLLLFPAFLSASKQFLLSKLVSLAICDVLVLEDVDPFIKWPNDILTNRGKITGILIEHGITGQNISHTIIGIGLNLNQTTFPVFPVSATSLVLEKGTTTELNDMAEKLTGKILARYEQLKSGKGDLIEQEYLERLYMIDRSAFFTSGGKEFQGMIRGVNEYGELLVEADGKIKSFAHQEIRTIH